MKFNKLFSGVLAVIALGAMTACTESVDYTPGVSSPGVFFPQNNEATVALDVENPTFTFQVARTGIIEASTYTLQSDAPAGIFTVPATFSFGKDENLTTVTVAFDPETIEAGTPYTINFTFAANAEVCNYGYNSYSVTVKVPSSWDPWQTMGTGIFSNILMYSEFIGEEGLPIDQPVTIEARNGADGAVQYRLSPVYYDKELVITYDPTIDQYLIEPMSTGEVFEFTDLGEREAFVCDGYTYVNVVNPAIKENPNYTIMCPSGSFDAAEGLFTIPVVYYVTEGYFAFGSETIQLDGYDKWETLGYADYVDGWILPALSTDKGPIDPVDYMWPVKMQQNKENPGLYRTVGMYQAGFPLLNKNEYDGSTVFLNIDFSDPEVGVIMPQQPGFINNEWGFTSKFIIYDMAGYYGGDLTEVINDNGTTLKDGILANGFETTLADNTITVNLPLFSLEIEGTLKDALNWKAALPSIWYLPAEEDAENQARANVRALNMKMKAYKVHTKFPSLNIKRNPRVTAIKTTL